MASKLDNIPDVLKPEHLWERQHGETEPAFQAFRAYLEMGSKRSTRAVAQGIHKNPTLIGRWSRRWEWVRRVAAHSSYLAAAGDRAREKEIAKQARVEIMCSAEVLARVSALARANPLDLFNKDGEFDQADVRRRGLGYLIAGIKTRTTTYPNGTVVETREFKVKPRKGFLELLGKHHGLWNDEIPDPDEIISRLTGIPKALIPAKLDDPTVEGAFEDVDGEFETVGEVSDKSQ